ncbi:MAG: DUF2834 domain-containing protein [Anaerolineales bacterium]
MKSLYLGLAALGGVVPYALLAQFLAAERFSVPRLLSASFVNGAAGAFTADLLIASFIFWIYMFRERSRNQGPRPLLFIALNLVVGLSCALPAYLYVREGRQRG